MTKATCHPRRFAVGNTGLCKICTERNIAAPKSDQAKELVELKAMYDGVQQVEEYGRLAKKILQSHLPGYAALHFEGAKIAAVKGDTRPAEWALQHVRTGEAGPPVDPPAKTGGDGGVRVFVGVQIGNLPPEAMSAQVIEMPPLSGSEASND